MMNIFATALPTPKSWLGAINPGSGIPKAYTGGDFLAERFFPFVISLMLFLVFVLSIVFLIWGGVMMMSSGGNKEGTAKAKSTITYAIIGLILALSSGIIVSVLFGFFGFKP